MKRIIKALHLLYRYHIVFFLPLAFAFAAIGKLFNRASHDRSEGWRIYFARAFLAFGIWALAAMFIIQEKKRQEIWHREGGTIINKGMWYLVGFGLVVAGFVVLFLGTRT